MDYESLLHIAILGLCGPRLPRYDENAAYHYVGDSAPDRSKPLRPEQVIREGDLPATHNALLSLPSPAWDAILAHLEHDPETLCALALVSSRCNLLAKSVQFRTVHLTYHPESIEFLVWLAEEEPHGPKSRARLGSFVRELVVCTDVDRMPQHTNAKFSSGAMEALKKQLEEAQDEYFDYVELLTQVIDMGCFPNLVTINWKDWVDLPPYVLPSFLRSPARNLVLAGRFDTRDLPCPHRDPELKIDVRALTVLGLSKTPGQKDTFDLLALVASTLEALSIKCMRKSDRVYTPKTPLPPFPRLRVLKIGQPLTSLSISTFASHHLHTLIIDGKDPVTPDHAGYLGNAGAIPSLRTLVCRTKMTDGDVVIPEFLSQNPQLTKLVVAHTTTEQFMSDMAAHLPNLTSLSLKGFCSATSDPKAPPLPRLESLEQLHLYAAGNDAVFPDIHLLASSLKSLPRLRKLAISHGSSHFNTAILAEGKKLLPLGWDSGDQHPEPSTRLLHPAERPLHRPPRPREEIARDQARDANRTKIMRSVGEFLGHATPALEFLFLGSVVYDLTRHRALPGSTGVEKAKGNTEATDELGARSGIVTAQGGNPGKGDLQDSIRVQMTAFADNSNIHRYIYNTWGHPFETSGWVS